MGVPKVVILCGGVGTRLREETEYKPKPLVTIGNLPIIWHIMKLYSYYGFKDFILCLGYKGRMIKEFFMDYEWDAFDFTLNLKSKDLRFHERDIEDWNITFANTGLDTMTAGRLKKVEKYVDTDQLMVTYGDGVSNVNIKDLLQFHNKHGKVGTITCVKPYSKYGVIRMKNSFITEFKEKPVLDDHINGGFMVFNKKVFDYIGKDCMLVEGTLPRLVSGSQLTGYEHNGFWHSMDTYKDYQKLNKMFEKRNTPWQVWK